MITNDFNINFSQGYFIKFLKEQKTNQFKNKILNVCNQHNVLNGYCFGFSNLYLQSVAKNKEKQFIDAFNNIPSDILSINHHRNSPENKEALITKAKKKADFENLSSLVINTQTFNINDAFIVRLKKLIKTITKSKNTHGEITFKEHLNTIIEILINKNIHNKTFSLDERKLYIKTLQEIHIIANELYRHALPNKKSFLFFKTKKNNPLENKSVHFKEIIQKIKDNCKIKNGEFTNQDIGKILTYSCLYYNTSIHQNWLEQNDIFSELRSNKELSFYRMQLSDFLNDEFIPNQERYYLILSQKHACAATITKQINGKYEYTFFDPNQGIKYFNNKKDFDHFIYNFTKENADYYNFIKSEKGDDYSIQFLDLGKPSFPRKLIHKKISMPDTQTLPPLEGTLV
ncbi:hypothetical protein GKR59_08075 [Providencia alcalifaciens]|uniref:YopT-type cysteine protease domain-containing protein n=1 Tax=Providencia TaxID=586 RepID=UPI0012B604E0|nr:MULTISPECIES: YopT-type cysteine protease domain-containing protein [Providencia]MTC49602.1 hypothetical protein [Providencia alcalifaciens]